MPECIGCGRDIEAFEVTFSDNKGLCNSCFDALYRKLMDKFGRQARRSR